MEIKKRGCLTAGRFHFVQNILNGRSIGNPEITTPAFGHPSTGEYQNLSPTWDLSGL